MTALRIAVVPGDGIGVDVIAEAVKALQAVAGAAGRDIRTTDFDWGAEKYIATGVTLPPGSYTIEPQPVEGFMRVAGPIAVTVGGGVVTLDVTMDTGIR